MLIKFQITELSENNPHAVKTPRGAKRGDLVLIDRDAEGQTDTWGVLTAPILYGSIFSKNIAGSESDCACSSVFGCITQKIEACEIQLFSTFTGFARSLPLSRNKTRQVR